MEAEGVKVSPEITKGVPDPVKVIVLVSASNSLSPEEETMVKTESTVISPAAV